MVKVLGVNSDHDTCHACGKTGLKKVVWIEINDSGPIPFGTDCASEVMRQNGKRRSARAIWLEAQEADRKRAADEKNRVHEIGSVRSVVDFYVFDVSSTGHARFIAKANGLRSEVVKWAESKFGLNELTGLHVVAPAGIMFNKVTW